MAKMSDYLENAVLNLVMKGLNSDGTTAVTAGATNSADPEISNASVELALYTTNPSDPGGGVECADSGYARQTVTLGAVSGGVVSNSGSASFPAIVQSQNIITGAAFFDAAGNMLFWSGLAANKTLDVGDSLTFDPGDLSVTLD
jgi:hypothetical protein